MPGRPPEVRPPTPGMEGKLDMPGMLEDAILGREVKLLMPGIEGRLSMLGSEGKLLIPGIEGKLDMPGIEGKLDMPGIEGKLLMPGIDGKLDIPGIDGKLPIPGSDGIEGKLLKPGMAEKLLAPGIEPINGRDPRPASRLSKWGINKPEVDKGEAWWAPFNEPSLEVRPWVTGRIEPTLPSTGRVWTPLVSEPTVPKRSRPPN